MFAKKRLRDYQFDSEDQNNKYYSDHQRAYMSHSSPPLQHFARCFENLYPFQRELCMNAIEGNSIICLPTGSGKTVIAACLVAFELEAYAGKKVVFVVNRIPLVMQQAAVIERSIPGVRVAKLTGEKKDASSLDDFLNSFDVAVAIDAVFLKWCSEDPEKLNNFSLFIFDEVHHARLKSLYARLLKLLHTHNERVAVRYALNEGSSAHTPIRIVGLSASPAYATTVRECENEIQGLLSRVRGRLLLVTEEAKDLQKRLKMATSMLVVFKETDFEKNMMEVFVLFSSSIVRYITSLDKVKSRSTAAMDQLFLAMRQPLMSSYFISIAQEALSFLAAENLVAYYHLVYLLSDVAVAASLLNECSPAYAVRFLARGSREARYFYTPELWETDEDKQIISETKQNVDMLFIAVAYLKETLLREQAECSNQSQAQLTSERAAPKDVVATPSKPLLLRDCSRLHLFLDLLHCILRREGGEEVRCIVFCSTKNAAAQLVERLNEESSIKDMNPLLFVGKNSSAATIGIATSQPIRMTESMQHTRLEEFRQGKCRLLIATSVAEEGVDVPACNYVFMYDGKVTLKSLIQIRGRARAHNSFLIVLTDEMQRNDANTVFESAKEYDNLLRRIASDPDAGQDKPKDFDELDKTLAELYLYEFQSKRNGTIARYICQVKDVTRVRVVAITHDKTTIDVESSGPGRRKTLWNALYTLCLILHDRGEIVIEGLNDKFRTKYRANVSATVAISDAEEKNSTAAAEDADHVITAYHPDEWKPRSSYLPSVLLFKEIRRRCLPKLEDDVIPHETKPGWKRVQLKFSTLIGQEDVSVTCSGETERIAHEKASLKMLNKLGYTLTKHANRIYLSLSSSWLDDIFSGEANHDADK